jgi:hypothetical protein
VLVGSGRARTRSSRARPEAPGCAVREAVEAGDLDQARLDSYRRLQHEMEVLERRKDTAADRKFFKKQGALAALAGRRSRCRHVGRSTPISRA